MSRIPLLAASVIAATVAALPLAAAAQSMRLHGVIVYADAQSLVVKDRGGEVVSLARPAGLPVMEVLPIRLSQVKADSYVGAGASPQPDGSQRAVEVLVFPESMRGTGAGFHPWDTVPNGTMTNATVATLESSGASAHGGQKMVLKYPGGEKTLVVPRGTPIVTFKPAGQDQAALVVPGAQVVVSAQVKDGAPTATSVLVGRDGFRPPM